MKKALNFIACIFFLFTFQSKIAFAIAPPNVSADGVVLMDATTGKILYSKNMDTPYPPASTTKIMTALLTLEKCKLDEIVKVGKKPPMVDGSKIYIQQDEEISVKDMLYALMLASANDAAEALAEHISGTQEKFVELMNARAKELGSTNTNFVNPHGLYDDKHRTTAKDMALIYQALTKYPAYKEIATTQSYKIAPTNKEKKERVFTNSNQLILKNSSSLYQGCEGGKTGYTDKSKHSFLSVATRNNQKIIVTLLHDSVKTFFSDAPKLFDYGFNNFELTKLFSKGDIVSKFNEKNLEVPLLAEEDFYYVRPKGNTNIPAFSLPKLDLNSMEFNKGDELGEVAVTFNNEPLGFIKLVSNIDHKIPKPIQDIKVFAAKKYNPSVCYITIFVSLLVIVTTVFARNRRRKFIQ